MEGMFVVLVFACAAIVHFSLPAVYRAKLTRLMQSSSPTAGNEQTCGKPREMTRAQLNDLRVLGATLAARGRIVHLASLTALALLNGVVVVVSLNDIHAPLQYIVGSVVFALPLVPAFVVAVRQRTHHPAVARAFLSLVAGVLLAAVLWTSLGVLSLNFEAGMLLLVGMQGVLGAIVVWLVGMIVLSGQRAASSGLRLSPHVLRIWTAVVAATALLIAVEGNEHGASAFAIAVSPLVVFVISRVVFHRVMDSQPDLPHLRLLFLRTFARPAETENSFRDLAGHMAFSAQVDMIAGADTAGAVSDASALVALLTGRLRRLFITNDVQLTKALEEARGANRFLDGRLPFRVLRCLNNMWQSAVSALMCEANVIVIDARGFNQQNGGLAFELERLCQLGAGNRTLVISDGATDQHLVRELAGDEPTFAEPRDMRERVWKLAERAAG